jgi:hypothetical protein
LEEDKLNYPTLSKDVKDAPAYRTVSLVNNAENALYVGVVQPLRLYLEGFIREYHTKTRVQFELSALDKKLLQADQLEDIKRFFVANLHEIYHSESLNSTRLIRNDYTKLKMIDAMFNLALIADQLLQSRFVVPSRNMADAIYKLAQHCNWPVLSKCRNAGDLIATVQPNPNGGSPDLVMPAFLNGTATVDGIHMNFRQSAIFGAYHMRNYAGHNIEGNNVVVDRYQDVLRLMMSAVFESVGTL